MPAVQPPLPMSRDQDGEARQGLLCGVLSRAHACGCMEHRTPLLSQLFLGHQLLRTGCLAVVNVQLADTSFWFLKFSHFGGNAGPPAYGLHVQLLNIFFF